MIRQVLNRDTIQKVFAISSGTIVAQALGLLAAPILTRLYLPAEFGAFAIYLNGVMLIAAVSCLRYEMTIVLVKQRRTAVLLVLLSALIAGVVSLLLWAPIMAFGDQIHQMVGLGVENHLLWALPVSLVLTALYKIASNWAVRSKDYAGLSLSKVWQSLPQMAGQISFGLFHWGVWGLVAGEMIGRLLGLLTLVYKGRKALPARMPMRLQRMRLLLSHYRAYPLCSTWSALINEAGSVAPVFCLAALYGAGTAGLFALVQRVFALPMDLVGQTAVTLYTAEASHAIRTNRRTLYGIFLKTFLSLVAIAVIPVVLMMWSGPRLFEVVFGHEWETAGMYAQIMAAAYGVRMAVSPLSQTLQMLGKQRAILFIEIARLMSIVSVFACGHLFKLGIEVVLSWYSGMVITFQMWMLFATWKAVKA